MVTSSQLLQVLIWHTDRLVFNARNPRKMPPSSTRMCGSIREFGYKIPVLARSDGEVVDGYLCLKVDGCKINSARCNQMLSLRPRR